MTVLVQLSGSLDMSQLPTPDVQLFSIAHDLDVCVEHMKEPLKIFAKDVKRPWSGEFVDQLHNIRCDGELVAWKCSQSVACSGFSKITLLPVVRQTVAYMLCCWWRLVAFRDRL